jgi:hypothetical protein
MDPKESQKAWGKVVAKAWSDAAFKERLLREPTAVLKENGIEVSADVVLKVVENSGKVKHLVLPEPPSGIAELSDEELDQVAGGLVTHLRLDLCGCSVCAQILTGGATKILTP